MYSKKIEELYKESLIITLEEHCSLTDAQTSTVSVMVGHYGKQIILEKHNISITIPKGAIERGITVEIVAAASCFAPFSFSKDYRCISSYLWIGANYVFKKPLTVEMEHHAAISREENLSKLSLMEGKTYDHTMCEVDDKSQYHFQIDSSRCTYFTKSGYTCLVSKNKKLADKVAVYYFLPKTYKSDNQFTAIFCLCYILKYCKQATENTYEEQGMLKEENHTLSVCCDEELRFNVSCTNETKRGCGVWPVGNNKINANQISFRKFNNEKEFKDGHRNNNPSYPPLFKVSVNRYGPSCLLDVQFVIIGAKKNKILFNLYFKPDEPIPIDEPKLLEPVQPVSSPVPVSEDDNSNNIMQNKESGSPTAHSGSEHSVYQPMSQQIPVVDTQQQVDYGATSTDGQLVIDINLIHKHVIPKINAKWQNIAIYLDYSSAMRNLISRTNKEIPRDCCTTLLEDWISTDNGVKPKTWEKLIEVLSKISSLTTVTKQIQQCLYHEGVLGEPNPTLRLQLESKASECPEEDSKVVPFEMSRSPTDQRRYHLLSPTKPFYNTYGEEDNK